jgi:hypothetical protein
MKPSLDMNLQHYTVSEAVLSHLCGMEPTVMEENECPE